MYCKRVEYSTGYNFEEHRKMKKKLWSTRRSGQKSPTKFPEARRSDSSFSAAQGVTSDYGSLLERAKNLFYLWYSLKFQNDLAAAADKVAKERNPNAPSSFVPIFYQIFYW